MGCAGSKAASSSKSEEQQAADSTLLPKPMSENKTIKESVATTPLAQESVASVNPLKIGATIPDFQVKTTKGDFSLHSWLTGEAEKPWTILFSHPKDFTPVCTTELGMCHTLAGQFAKQGVKLIGVSCDDTESHHGWSKDVLARAGSSDDSLAFPIVADSDREIVTALGMLDPEEKTAEGVPLPARALVILLGTVVKLTILYPATTGRNFVEVLRTITSLQLTANNGLATPVDWKLGERVIVGPAVKTEDAQAKYEEFKIEELPSGKPYLRSVKCPTASDAASTMLAAKEPPAAGVNPLKIGATIPDFQVKTTKGDLGLHSFLTGDTERPWTILFSHPKDFTPVCTTELGACHSLAAQFGKLGTKLIGLSCDDTESHHAWSKDVLHRIGSGDDSLAFPIIADSDREIVSALGMLDPEERTAEGVPLPARALVILNGTTVRLTILYPATTGRNFDEVLRVLVSLQLTANNGLATPVDWKYGDRVIVGPAVKTEDAQAKFEEFKIEELPSGKPYLRSVKCPEMARPTEQSPSLEISAIAEAAPAENSMPVQNLDEVAEAEVQQRPSPETSAIAETAPAEADVPKAVVISAGGGERSSSFNCLQCCRTEAQTEIVVQQD